MLHNILELIAAGTIGFWLILIIDSFFLMGCIENESTGWSIIWLIILGLLVGPAVTAHIHLPWYYWIGIFVGYFIIGGLWSLYKWNSLVREKVEDWRGKHKPSDSNYKDQAAYFTDTLRPSYFKGMLYMWIAYWPWSLVWSLVRDIVNNVYRALLRSYQSIVDRQTRKLIP